MSNFSDPSYRKGYYDAMPIKGPDSFLEWFTHIWDLGIFFSKYAYLLGILIFTILAFGKVAGVALFAAPFVFRKYLWRGSRKVWYYLGLFGVAFLVLSAHGGTLVAPDHTAHPVAHSAAR
jgi:hypothetical protein